MPSVRLKLDAPESPAGAGALPEILRTATGTVMLEIQGQINVGSQPLLRTELDSSTPTAGVAGGVEPGAPTLIGSVDLSRITESGAPVTLEVGENQLLRGNVTKLANPLAIMDVSDPGADEISVVDIITHKVVFSKRPEPVLKR